MVSQTRFRPRRAAGLIGLTAAASFVLTFLLLGQMPEQIPQIWQHVLEFTAVFGGGVAALFILEAQIGDQYDDSEFLLFLIVFGLAYLAVDPIIAWWNLPYGVAVNISIMSGIQAALAVIVTVGLERTTEFI